MTRLQKLFSTTMSILQPVHANFRRAVLMAAFLIAASPIYGVILMSTADPAANTTEPTGALAGSGWQYEAAFGPFCATAIGPHHFLTVKHIGTPSNVFIYQGATYTITQSFDDPGSELRIFEVAETVPVYAPLYSNSDEQGRNILVVGRGTQRGNPIYLGGTLRGWEWGAEDQVQRWGENQVAEATGYTLYASFDQNAGPNECHLSSGDSGGAMFINDSGVWKLAGINFSVDGPFSTTPGGSAFNALLFDARGFYDVLGNLISSSGPASSGFYAMRISERLPWIWSVVFPGAQLPNPTPTPAPTPTPTPTPLPTATPSSNGPAQILSPVPGSTFASASATFSWNSGSANLYKLSVGNSPGAADIYSSGKLSTHSATVNNLPTNGSVICVRLSSQIRRQWQSIDYTYNAYSYNPISVPTPTPAPTASPTPTPTPTPDPTARPHPTPPENGE